MTRWVIVPQPYAGRLLIVAMDCHQAEGYRHSYRTRKQAEAVKARLEGKWRKRT